MTRRVTDTEVVRDAVAIALWHANRKFDAAIRELQPVRYSRHGLGAAIDIEPKLSETFAEAMHRWRVGVDAMAAAFERMAKRYEERTHG